MIQDAMKFASIMPNIFGGSGGPGPQQKGGAKGPDLANIMSMMSSMMGSGGEDNDFSSILKGMAKNAKGSAPKGSRTAVNESALKKIAKAKKLKKKLHERKKEAAKEATDTTQQESE